MTTKFLSEDAKTYLNYKKIINVGANYIQLSDGICIYLDEEAIEHLNNQCEFEESNNETNS